MYVQNDYAERKGKKRLDAIFTLQPDGRYRAKDALYESGEMVRILEHLIENRGLVSRFVEENRSKLTEKEIETYRSWEHFVASEFIVMQTHDDSQIFAWDPRKHRVYLVYGLYDPMATLIPRLPFSLGMMLFPYKGRMVFNGFFIGQNIEYGNNIVRQMVEDYSKDIADHGIVLDSI